MAEKCINRISARPTPPHTNPMESGPGNTFSAQNRKTKRFMTFDPKKGGGHFFDIFDPPPSFKSSKKWVSSGGGGGASGPKTHWGMRVLDKIMILQGVFKLTIQPLGVGYANRPKKGPKWGVCSFFPYIRLPGFDLTTSAR